MLWVKEPRRITGGGLGLIKRYSRATQNREESILVVVVIVVVVVMDVVMVVMENGSNGSNGSSCSSS